MQLIDFNIMNYEASSVGYETIPEGDYKAIVLSTEIKPTSSAIRNGTKDCFLSVRLMIDGGIYSGANVFDVINLVNSNEDAQNIGRRRLRGLAKICGVEEKIEKTRDVSLLNGCSLIISVGVEEYNNTKRNKVKSYKRGGGSSSLNISPIEIPKDVPNDTIPF